MESSRWLTMLLIGLVLAGLVVGYFLLRSTFLQRPITQSQVAKAPEASPPASTPSEFILGQNTGIGTNPTPMPTSTPIAGGFGSVVISTPTPISTPRALGGATTTPPPTPKPGQIANANTGNVTTLPSTGIQTYLVGVFSFLAVIIGWKLRKYPNI